MSTIFYSNDHCTLYHGDALTTLRTMQDESIDCCMTSPPYWGLRSYQTVPRIWDGDPNCSHVFAERKYAMHNGRGDAQKGAKYSEQDMIPDQQLSDATCLECGAWRGELGLEPTFQMYISHLVAIFGEVKRILKPEGTCWVNLGDTYSGSGGNNTNCSYSRKGSGGNGEMGDGIYARLKKRASFEARRFDMSGIPGKSLCMIPERFAMAMIDQQQWTLRNKIVWHKPNVMPSSIKDRFTVDWEYLFFFTKSRKYYFNTQYEPYQSDPKDMAQYLKSDYEGQSLKDYFSAGAQDASDTKRRIIANMRSRFGRDKAAGYDSNLYSGNKWDPNTVKGRIKRAVWNIPTEPYGDEHYAAYPIALCKTPILAGCMPDGTVLDPFCGTGTTGEAALSLARNFVGMDVSEKFCKLATERLDKYIGQERFSSS